MREVSSILITNVLGLFDEAGYPVRELIVGLDIPADAQLRVARRIDWDAMAELYDRFLAWGGEERMVTVATQFVPQSPAMRALGKALLTPERTYAFVADRYSRLLYSNMTQHYERVRRGVHRFSAQVHEGFRGSRGLMFAVYGSGIGSVSGYFDAKLEASRIVELTDRRGVFEFEFHHVPAVRGAELRRMVSQAVGSVLDGHLSQMSREGELLAEELRVLQARRRVREELSEALLGAVDFDALWAVLGEHLWSHLRMVPRAVRLEAAEGEAQSLVAPATSEGSRAAEAGDGSVVTRWLPLTMGGAAVGTLEVQHFERAGGGSESSEQVALFDELGSVVALAVQRAVLYEGLRAAGAKPVAEALEREALLGARAAGAAESQASALREEATRRAAAQWGLTEKQQRVLGLLAEGASNAAIAGGLGCSMGNVEYHLGKLLRAAGVHTRTELLAAVWRTGG